MPLAGEQHHRALVGHRQRAADRLAAVGHDAVVAVARAREAALDLGDDRQRVLAPRVVGGQDRQLGGAGGSTHRRPLAAIAIAAAAEDAPQLALAMLAKCAQRRFETRRSMCVVHEHGRQAAFAVKPHALHPAGRRRHAGEQFAGFLERYIPVE